MIKLIAMDFDWTLVDHTKGAEKIRKEIMTELNDFINKGNWAGIVSGREFWNFELEFQAFGVPWNKPFPNYVIGREAYIYKIKDGDYEGIEEHNNPLKKKIINLNRVLSQYMGDILDMYEEAGIAVNNFYIYGHYAVEVHVEMTKADEALELMKEFVKEKGFKDAAVHRNGMMITIYHKEAGKGNALFAAAKAFGLKPSEILAIGDNYNDISMIDGRFGFIGACVGNADDNIKKLVREGGGYVGEGVAHKGILDVLRQLKKDGLMD